MESPALDLIMTSLADKKAENVSILNIHALSSISDYMIIATANSTQQARALAENVIETAKLYGISVLGQEGMEHREWVLVDLGNIIVHIMLPEIRAYYELEKLWAVEEAKTTP